MKKELYKDCQKDYEENLKVYLNSNSEEEKTAAWHNIFIDFKTYCFNKIRKMRSFLPIETIDDWATTVTCNALSYISKKDTSNIENWPINMGAYLGLCCLDINNIKKYSKEKIEVPSGYVDNKGNNTEGETLLMIDEKCLDVETGVWVVKEAVKMTVANDGFSMLDIDRAMKLIERYNGKIGKFNKKYTDIKNALEKNILYILNMKKDNKESK